MCSVELKKSIYDCFDQGLNVEETIKKLNISHEKRVVCGCYQWWCKKKENNNYGMDKVEEYNNKLDEIYKEQVSNITKIIELMEILQENIDKINSMDLKHLESKYTFFRQIVLHDIENEEGYDKPNEELYYKLKLLSKGRRKTKQILDVGNINIECLDKVNNMLRNSIHLDNKEDDLTVAFASARAYGVRNNDDYATMLKECIGEDRFKKINTIKEDLKDRVCSNCTNENTNGFEEKQEEKMKIGDEYIYKKGDKKEKHVIIHDILNEEHVQVRLLGSNTKGVVKVKDLTKVDM